MTFTVSHTGNQYVYDSIEAARAAADVATLHDGRAAIIRASGPCALEGMHESNVVEVRTLENNERAAVIHVTKNHFHPVTKAEHAAHQEAM